MLVSYSAVPGAYKATVFRIARLKSKEDSYLFKITTDERFMELVTYFVK